MRMENKLEPKSGSRNFIWALILIGIAAIAWDTRSRWWIQKQPEPEISTSFVRRVETCDEYYETARLGTASVVIMGHCEERAGEADSGARGIPVQDSLRKPRIHRQDGGRARGAPGE